MSDERKQVSKNKAIERLKQLVEETRYLRTLHYGNEEIRTWRTRVKDLLSIAFDDDDYQKFSNVRLRADMRIMGDEVHQSNYQYNLVTLKTILQSIIDKHEILEEEAKFSPRDELKDDIEESIYLFNKMHLHPKIVKASKSLFENGHYAQAIFEAFKAVENFVQDKSNLNLYGTNLMDTVFNEENPIIKVPEAGHYYKDVQRGFKHLFVGAAQGIRNPKAHKEIIQKDPYITLQYLGFASFLLKRIDYWEAGIS